MSLVGVAFASGANPTQVYANPIDATEKFQVNEKERLLVARKFRRTEMAFRTTERVGTIIVDPSRRYLYLIRTGGKAIRYGVGVGRQGFEWSGDAIVKHKAKWPKWTPPPQMVARDKEAEKWANGMPGGPRNPLGARALYLFQGNVDTLFRIHGTFQPRSIGKAISSGCIRMINADIIDLYSRVRLGTRVKVLASTDPIDVAEN